MSYMTFYIFIFWTSVLKKINTSKVNKFQNVIVWVQASPPPLVSMYLGSLEYLGKIFHSRPLLFELTQSRLHLQESLPNSDLSPERVTTTLIGYFNF